MPWYFPEKFLRKHPKLFNMKNCAIIGWEEGIAGQVSDWINYNILFYIYPKDDSPKINLKEN